MTGATAGVVVLLAIVGPLLLYVLVRSEHDDREQAERAARRDIDTSERFPRRNSTCECERL